jgi:prolyl-tRNA synthetase
MMGGTDSHEFVLIAEDGENVIVRCENDDYAANLETARCAAPVAAMPAPLPLAEVATPGTKTIEDVARFLGVPTSQTLKSMMYFVGEQLAMVVLRGDRTINDYKLQHVLGTDKYRPALPDEIRAGGAVEGYASPLGLHGMTVYADESVRWGGNFVAGANKEGYHVQNANVGRDLHFDRFYDIGNVQEGDRCPVCNGALSFTRGIEVGHIFKLGTKYTESLHAYYLDKDGVEKPIIMGCYGIGSGRLMAAAVEQHHDDKGIIWPMAIAPFQVHLVGLGLNDAAIREAAERTYGELTAAGIEVLFDDRDDAQAGVKFNDADLIGIPIRLTLSPRSVKSGGVEIKLRREATARVAPLADLALEIRKLIDTLMHN